ncbi:PREDICTED: ankyrin repeat domain-containing protein 33B [Bison bison bison]|uniref:Ankyrin repeat domain-containing protein 33B n=1 Tax=Bison bison bison TaxID=43346 RepID=A0A6P3I261_BISBB|nr:PREDICTED: ankyrin repeat domain-containing protein 33B [Bison bison bison]
MGPGPSLRLSVFGKQQRSLSRGAGFRLCIRLDSADKGTLARGEGVGYPSDLEPPLLTQMSFPQPRRLQDSGSEALPTKAAGGDKPQGERSGQVPVVGAQRTVAAVSLPVTVPGSRGMGSLCLARSRREDLEGSQSWRGARVSSITPVTLGHPRDACTPALPLAVRRPRLTVQLCFRFYQGDFSQMFTGNLFPEAGWRNGPQPINDKGPQPIKPFYLLIRRSGSCVLGFEGTGLIVACYHGFVDTVVILAECPHVDVNWQDSEGNTALITAAQAGHVTITNYLLNYFPGLDLERRNAFGFTALMKAAMQGRTECIRALMLAGADVHARDSRRGMSSQEWATYTGRFEAVRVIQRLLEGPCPEQFGVKYKPELPLALEAGQKPTGSKSCLQKLTDFVRSTLTSRSRQGMEDGGALDHMVKMTTSLYSPAVAIVCQTVCPESPPCVGKRRLAVKEILASRGDQDTQAQERDKGEGPEPQSQTSQAAGVSKEEAPRAGLASSQPPVAPRRASLLPLQLLRRSSVRPGVTIPKVRVSKAPAPTFQPERAARGSTKDSSHLQLPKWRYKEAKEEKRKAEEAEKQRLAAAQKEKRTSSWRKRT